MRRDAFATTLALALGVLMLCTSPAAALSKHVFSSAFTGEGPLVLNNPTDVAVDQSTGDVYVANPAVNELQAVDLRAVGVGDLTAGSPEVTAFSQQGAWAFAVGDAINGVGIPAGTVVAKVESGEIELSKPANATVTASTLVAEPTGGAYTLSFGGQATAEIPYNATALQIESDLAALSNIGPGNVRIVQTSFADFAFQIEFMGALARTDVPQVTADFSHLTAGTATTATIVNGSSHSDVEKFTAAGGFLLVFGKEVNRTKVDQFDEPGNPHGVTEAEEDVCDAGEDCQPGAPGSSPGAFSGTIEQIQEGGSRLFLAVDNSPEGKGDLYVGDPGDELVSKFDSSGRLISGWGNHGQLDGTTADKGDFTGTMPRFSLGLGGISIGTDGTLFVLAGSGGKVFQFTPGGGFLSSEYFKGPGVSPIGIAFDAGENFYFASAGGGGIEKAMLTTPAEKIFKNGEGTFREGEAGLLSNPFAIEDDGEVTEPSSTRKPAGFSVEPLSRALFATEDEFGGSGSSVWHFSPSCEPNGAKALCTPFETFGSGQLSLPKGVAVNAASGAVYVADTGNQRVAVFSPVPDLPTAAPSPAHDKSPSEETLEGEVDPDGGGSVEGCHFEYAPRSSFLEGGGGWAAATSEPCSPAPDYSALQPVEAEAAGLIYGTRYRFRLTVENASGSGASFAQAFTTLPQAPTIGATSVEETLPETVKVSTQINPGGGPTTYSVEYVTEQQFAAHEWAEAVSSPELDAGSARTVQALTAQLRGLAPGTTYHYRVVARNAEAAVTGGPQTFTTLTFNQTNDNCPNAHVRQQTSAAQLLDCRAYELVSAADSGGYDVESNLIEGQTPFAGYPLANGRVLYGVQDGGIPGTGEPTNRGVDPYVAVRGEGGWSTEYVGIPAKLETGSKPFSSTLLEADPKLDAFAFGGPEICAPCFSEGIETGIPLHLNGRLVQGMAPQVEETAVKPDGYIAKYFSADGSHFVFGSTAQFAEDGNPETGDVSIYSRDLETGETHAVSDDEAGEPLTCVFGKKGTCNSTKKGGKDPNGIAELGISEDGSHVLVAQKVSEDVDHNVYWHLYMDIGDSAPTIDLTPGVIAKFGGTGFKEGVLFAGMTADGSKVFFTTKDKLTTEADQDSDSSADLYEAELVEEGGETKAVLTRLSSGEGGTGNTDSCDPVANSNGPHWNTVESSEEKCGVVAVGGGGGVAAVSGGVYFLSPEKLTPSCACLNPLQEPVQNQPNLYLAAPGQPLHFVATLEPDNPLVLNAVKEAGTRHTADFQLTPDGKDAAFPSALALLPSVKSAGHDEVYRYDAHTEEIDCVSCNPSGAPSVSDAHLASDGLSLSDDGRVFFDTGDALVLTDTDRRQDVYEWARPGTGNCSPASAAFSPTAGACIALVSAGTSSFDSGLLGAGASGIDVYFFTRDSLVLQDENGPTMKIYDAREGGGFPYFFPVAGCRASDECHGPASPAPPPLAVGSESGTEHNYEKCKKGFVLKHGECARKPKKPKRHRHGHRRRTDYRHGGGR